MKDELKSLTNIIDVELNNILEDKNGYQKRILRL